MKFIRSLFNYIFIALMGYIILLISLYDSFSNLWALAVSAIVIILLCLLVRSKNSVNINYKRLWLVVLLVFPILLVITTISLQVSVWENWDFAKLYFTSYEYVHHKPLSVDYYAKYPNNTFWVSCLIGIYKLAEFIFGSISFENFVYICMILSCLCVYLTVIIIHKTARLIWDDKRAFYVGLGCCGFLPLYLYAQYFYTDTSALLCVALFIYIYFKIRTVGTTRKYILAALLGIIAALIFNVKVLSFIIPFAVLLDSITKIFEKKKFFICLGIAICCAVASFFAFQSFSNCYLKISDSQKQKLEYPSTHWVMMGLNKEKNGGYIQSDVDYTGSFKNYDDKKTADIKKINQRIDKMGYLGTAKQVLINKSFRTWSEGSLGGREYITRHPLHKNSFAYNLLSEKGSYHIISYIYSNIYYFVILLGMLLSSIFSIKRKRYELNALRISMIGITVFMWLWECNPRYLFTFIPVFILLSAEGIGELFDSVKKRG